MKNSAIIVIAALTGYYFENYSLKDTHICMAQEGGSTKSSARSTARSNARSIYVDSMEHMWIYEEEIQYFLSVRNWQLQYSDYRNGLP